MRSEGPVEPDEEDPWVVPDGGGEEGRCAATMRHGPMHSVTCSVRVTREAPLAGRKAKGGGGAHQGPKRRLRTAVKARCEARWGGERLTQPSEAVGVGVAVECQQVAARGMRGWTWRLTR